MSDVQGLGILLPQDSINPLFLLKESKSVDLDWVDDDFLEDDIDEFELYES